MKKSILKGGHVTLLTLNTDENFIIKHIPEDNIESLFYILIWITVLHNGLSGQKQEDFDFNTSFLVEWVEISIHNLSKVHNAKVTLISSENFNFTENVSSYVFSIHHLTP